MTKLRYDIAITNIEAIHSLSHTGLESNDNALLFKTRCLNLRVHILSISGTACTIGIGFRLIFKS